MLTAARAANAARHPQVTTTTASTGATAIFATEAAAVMQALGRPRFSGGCHVYTAVCSSALDGPSASPNAIRLTSRTAKPATTRIDSMAAAQASAMTTMAQRSVSHLS